MKKILLIVAAGKSSRFGGFPKAFCKIGDKTVFENTIDLASNYFDSIYFGVNQDVFNKYKNNYSKCRMFGIVTGQGDAHSILKCLNYVKECEKEMNSNDDLYICWGDAFFINSTPFWQMCSIERIVKVEVACSIDTNPYAWFETKDGFVIKTHFSKVDGIIDKGIHDQSLFRCDPLFCIEYLDKYRKSLGISMNNNVLDCEKNEMRLLDSFVFLAESSDEKARIIMIDSGNIISFNTKEELDLIENRLILSREKNV